MREYPGPGIGRAVSRGNCLGLQPLGPAGRAALRHNLAVDALYQIVARRAQQARRDWVAHPLTLQQNK